ncbi:MAG: 30S ribosomal protein S21 [Nitrosopumilaceae archaeon]
MPGVRLKHEYERIDSLLKRFKKAVERSGLEKELRKRQHYQKPCEVRKGQKAAARKREEKRQDAQKIIPPFMKKKEKKIKKGLKTESMFDSLF